MGCVAVFRPTSMQVLEEYVTVQFVETHTLNINSACTLATRMLFGKDEICTWTSPTGCSKQGFVANSISWRRLRRHSKRSKSFWGNARNNEHSTALPADISDIFTRISCLCLIIETRNSCFASQLSALLSLLKKQRYTRSSLPLINLLRSGYSLPLRTARIFKNLSKLPFP